MQTNQYTGREFPRALGDVSHNALVVMFSQLERFTAQSAVPYTEPNSVKPQAIWFCCKIGQIADLLAVVIIMSHVTVMIVMSHGSETDSMDWWICEVTGGSVE